VDCPRCGAANEDRARFCAACGVALAPACAACGLAAAVGARFCSACGTPLPGGQGRRGFGSPATYTPRRLAEKILGSRTAMEGERKQVTVLFADLKGSLELIADRDAEQARHILDAVLERMMEAIHHYEGTVNQVMGDGIMALFGAPVAHEDHAVRACYAALRMQESVQRWAETARRDLGVMVAIRIGLNSGDVVVRTITNDLRMDYSAVGRAAHLAARFEQMAMPGTTLLSADTAALVEDLVQLRPLGPVAVRGVDTAVAVYELIGVGPLRTQFQRAAARGFTHFVGRQREMDLLHRAAEEAGAGRGRVVAVVGDAGVGKSRLVWELSRSLAARGWLVLEGRGLAHERASAYRPIAELLRAYFAVEPSDDGTAIRGLVAAGLLALDGALGARAPALQALLDAPVDDARWNRLDPVARRRETIESVRILLLRQSQARPILVVVDDLQWVDPESQALLDGLLPSLPGARVLLLTCHRTEFESPWSAQPQVEKLRLETLSTDGATLLLGALLGDDASLRELKPLLVDRTRGNPFFLEESVTMLASEGALTGQRGAYRLAQAPSVVHIPPTVRAVVAARIDRLDRDDKRLLETAAVIGKDVPFDLLQAIGDLGEEDLRAGLGRLHAAEFLHETRLFPEVAYAFRHPLTHEIAYGGLVQERRRQIHARVASALQQADPARIDERIGTLAYHAFHGGLWEQAVTWLRRAGAKAALRSASREAVVRFEQALEALTHLPATRANVERAIDLRFDLRNPLFLLAEFPRALQVLEEVDQLAQTLEEPERLGRACTYMANAHFMLGNIERGVALARRALEIGDKLGDAALLAFTWCHLGQLHYVRGEFGASIAAVDRCLELLGTGAVGRPALVQLYGVVAHCFRALADASRGQFEESLAAAARCMTVAGETDAPFYRALAAWATGHAHLARGDLGPASTLLTQARTECDNADIRSIRPWISADLGHTYLFEGRTREAIAILEDAVAQASSWHLMAAQSVRLARLGEAYLRAGRPDDAAAMARRALDIAVEHGEHAFRAWALRLDAAIAAERGDLPAALTGYGQALELATTLQMRPLVACGRLELAEVQARAGQQAEAEGGMRAAAALFREMSMPYWLRRAEAGAGSVSRATA
jgi:class 3 adenylate cyclase/tetratricopeptide (TPR) repeat protein